MKLEDVTTVDQLTDCLSGTQAVAVSVLSDTNACYRWVPSELAKFRYPGLSRGETGVVIRYLVTVSGYSRQQITRLIRPYRKPGILTRRQRTVQGFARRYTAQDIGLLAAMDEIVDKSVEIS